MYVYRTMYRKFAVENENGTLQGRQVQGRHATLKKYCANAMLDVVGQRHNISYTFRPDFLH